MKQKQLFRIMTVLFLFVFVSCQSIRDKSNGRDRSGQVQSILAQNHFDPLLQDKIETNLEINEETKEFSRFEQNDAEEETIFSDAQNYIGAYEPLLESDQDLNQICEDSIYYHSWKSQFDQKWLSQNRKKYKYLRARNSALARARSDAYLELAYSSLDKTSYDFPMVINRQVASWIDYFTGSGRNHFVIWLSRAQELAPKLTYILEKNGLPKDLIYLAMIESGFNNRAVSWVGAVGTWQFMPYTGKLYGLHINDWIDERRDPIKATNAAAKFLTDLYTRFGSWHLAAGAYNCGEGCISRKLKQYGREKSYFDLTDRGVINRQTANYVPKIIAAMIIAKNPERFGFDTKNHRYSFTETRAIRIDRSIALSDLARQVGVDPKILADLNPSLRLGITPPRHALASDGFEVIVPISVYRRSVGAIHALPDVPQNRIVQAKITYRQSVYSFAKRYGFAVSDIRRTNKNFAKRKFLNKGETINVPVVLGTGQYNKLLSIKKPARKVYKTKRYTSKTKRTGKKNPAPVRKKR